MLFRIHAIILAAFLAGPLWAAECGDLSTPKAVLDCVLKNDPRVLASEQRVKRAEGEAKAAGAWNNPELEGEYLRPGTGDGERMPRPRGCNGKPPKRSTSSCARRSSAGRS
jgi:hypothetical protein